MSATQVRSAARPVEQVRAAAAVIVISGLAWRVWAAWNGWFYADDFLLVQRARDMGFTVDMLMTPNDSQLMPLGMVVAWLVGLPAGLTWWPAALSLIVMQTAALGACWAMLSTVFGERWATLVPLGLFAFSPMAMDNSLWWAASLNGLPAQAAFFLLVLAVVQWSRERRVRWAVLASFAFALAALSGPRGLLVAIPIGILTIGLLTPSGHWRTLPRRLFSTHWPIIAPPAVLGAMYLLVYRSVAPAPLSTSTDAQHGKVLWNLIVESWAPSLLGGPVWWNVVADPISVPSAPRVIAVTAAFIVVTLMLLLVFRGGRTGRVAVAMMTAQLMATYVAIDFGRALQLGPDAALNTRYYPDVLAVTVVALAFAVMGRAESRPATTIGTSMIVSRRGQAIVGTSAVVFATSLVSVVTFTLPWHRDFPAHRFVDNAVTSLQAQPRPVADVEVPELVQLPIHFPENLVSRLLAPYPDVVDPRTEGNDLFALGPDGTAGPALVNGATSDPGPELGCGWRIDNAEVRIAMDRNDMNLFPWTTINYAASGDGRAVVTFDDRKPFEIDLLAGAHTWFVRGDGAYSTLTIRTLEPGTVACVDGVRSGRLDVSP
ncbi:hypothetical protein [Aeromicrobium sp. CF3.5]|uniref:hypothetical protein n=1 Tax=Aeromicrobium sp. CF3.5 TaxID=3373078 RepID=UPI003EE5C46D